MLHSVKGSLAGGTYILIQSIFVILGCCLAQAISDLRDAVDGRGNADESIVARGGVYNMVPTDPDGIAFSRTPAQVLAIVYLGDASTPGGFFPEGLNGRIA